MPPTSWPDAPEGERRRSRTLRGVALLVVLALVTGAFFVVRRAGDTEPEQPASQGAGRAPTTACTAAGELRGTSAGTLEQQIARTSQQVERIRNLRFKDEVESRAVTPDRLAERLIRTLDDYPDRRAEKDARALELLGIVEPGFDVKELYEQLYRTAVAGVYLPKKDRFLVGTEEEEAPLAPGELSTLAHELQHALADQHFGLPEEVEVPQGEEDASLAEHALIEGDATVTQDVFVQSVLSADERAAILADPATRAQVRDYFAIPPYFRMLFEFPYTYGRAFVRALCARGGWDAVDAAYAERPRTTAQILFPERYFEDERAEDVPDLEPPGGGARRAYRVAVGAADLLFIFQAPGGDTGRALDDPRDLAARWAGGRFSLWTRGDDSIGALQLVERDGADLCAPLGAWYLASFPDATMRTSDGAARFVFDGAEQDAVITCRDDDVTLAIAPDETTARELAESARR